MFTRAGDTPLSKTTVLARAVSDSANPFFLAPAVVFTMALFQHVSILQLGFVAAISIFFYTLLPIGVLLLYKKRRFFKDYDIPDRQQRIKPYSLALLSYGIAGILISIYLPSNAYYVKYAAICYLINPLLGFVITLGWKISIHCASISSAAAILVMYPTSAHSSPVFFMVYYALTAFLLFLIPLMMWSRIQLKIHTFAQVTIGTVVGYLATTSVLVFL